MPVGALLATMTIPMAPLPPMGQRTATAPTVELERILTSCMSVTVTPTTRRLCSSGTGRDFTTTFVDANAIHSAPVTDICRYSVVG